jgi:hypothetical protein
MKAKILTIAAILALGSSAWAQTTVQDGNVTPGNADGTIAAGTTILNGGFKVVTSADTDLQLGLRAAIDHQNTFPNDGTGTFAVPEGQGINASRASWGYQFSIVTSGGTSLSDYSFSLSLDGNPGAGDNFTVIPNLLSVITDSGPTGSTTIAQNSENAAFLGVGIPGYNPDVPGIYDIILTATDKAGVSTSDEITVDVGNVSTIPDATSTLPLLGVAIAGLALVGRKVKATA